jgi:hypothetical protein
MFVAVRGLATATITIRYPSTAVVYVVAARVHGG